MSAAKMNRRTVQGANWGLFLLLCVALVGLVNYLSFRHYHRWDWTSGGSYSLSGQSEKLLSGLKEPVEVVVFLAPGDELFDRVKGLLTAYADAGAGKVTVEYIDPDRQKARMELLAKKYQVSQANCVVFAAGAQSRYIEKDQMVEYDFAGYQYGQTPKVKAFKAEEAFTNALQAVVEPATPTVYFTEGHGERGSEKGAGRGEGMTTLRDRLERSGAKLRGLPTLGKGEVPADADLVVVAGPRFPFSGGERKLLEDYLSKGGRLLLLLDPLWGEGAPPTFTPTGLEALCAQWGVGLGQDIALDPEVAVPLLGAQTFYAADLAPHPATKDLAQNSLPVVLDLARTLTLADPQVAGEYRTSYLMRTSEKGWGERDLAGLATGVAKDATDTPGPADLALAVSSEKPGQKARLVVVGDSDFASDSRIQSAGGNLLLATNLFHWLLGQENRIAIPPKTAVETHLNLTSTEANTLFVLLTVTLPLAVVGLGVWVYLRRRR